MHKFSWFYYSLFLAGSFSMSAQKSIIYTHELKDFDRAVYLFKEQQYASAQILFDKVKEDTDNEEVKSDCAYYEANCAIRIGKQTLMY